MFNEKQKQQARVNSSFSKMTMGSAHSMERSEVRQHLASALRRDSRSYRSGIINLVSVLEDDPRWYLQRTAWYFIR